MRIACEDVDRLLKAEDAAARTALAAHAGICPACRERVAAWSEMSAAAQHMRKEWDSPRLWPKIQSALEAEAVRADRRERTHRMIFFGLRNHWKMAAALVIFILLPMAAVLVLLRNFEGRGTPYASAEKRLLTEQALREIEVTQEAYVLSIDKLARLAETRIESPATPLLGSYREKLLLIDDAIADCRAAIEQNRYNAHLRLELLAMYREKQKTLQEIMKENANDLR